MDLNILRKAFEVGAVYWQRHALQRMFERNISREDVHNTVMAGKIIESYSTDNPYPSALVANIDFADPLHVVLAGDNKKHTCYVITAYVPDEDHFE